MTSPTPTPSSNATVVAASMLAWEASAFEGFCEKYMPTVKGAGSECFGVCKNAPKKDAARQRSLKSCTAFISEMRRQFPGGICEAACDAARKFEDPCVPYAPVDEAEVARLVNSAKDAAGWQANGWMRIEPREIEPSPLPPIPVASPARDERLIAEAWHDPDPEMFARMAAVAAGRRQ